MGVLTRGTLFMSKGLSEGSRVYWCRDFSRPGTDTDRPGSTTRLKMNRMYLEGAGVRGPSLPSRCRILVASTVCSQSSMNSHSVEQPEPTLNSSEISDTKEEICFMRRSTLLSLPVFSSVVMASVAMLRFESVIRFSRSRLHAVTADGCFIATW
ncbi:hypothetical protein CRUP_018583 [Coryphaenoides rupestris]|nr:hypothetical protein CRUP_018583 [Coryphaenoides rupestris]